MAIGAPQDLHGAMVGSPLETNLSCSSLISLWVSQEGVGRRVVAHVYAYVGDQRLL